LVTLPPALPSMCPGILPRLSLDSLGIRLFEERCQLGTELREMIEQLCVCKIVRRRNTRMLINCGDPGSENLIPVGGYILTTDSDRWESRFLLAETSDERIPPNLIS